MVRVERPALQYGGDRRLACDVRPVTLYRAHRAEQRLGWQVPAALHHVNRQLGEGNGAMGYEYSELGLPIGPIVLRQVVCVYGVAANPEPVTNQRVAEGPDEECRGVMDRHGTTPPTQEESSRRYRARSGRGIDSAAA